MKCVYLIFGYIWYVSVVLVIALYNTGKRDFWPVVILWCISFPIGMYLLFWMYKVLKNKRSMIVSDNKTSSFKSIILGVSDEANSSNKLTREQAYLLYYCADHIGRDSPNQKSILSLYREELGIDKGAYLNIVPMLHSLKFEDNVHMIKNIKEQIVIKRFLWTCVYLVDVTQSYLCEKEFFYVLQELNLSIDSLREIMKDVESIHTPHFYDRKHANNWNEIK